MGLQRLDQIFGLVRFGQDFHPETLLFQSLRRPGADSSQPGPMHLPDIDVQTVQMAEEKVHPVHTGEDHPVKSLQTAQGLIQYLLVSGRTEFDGRKFHSLPTQPSDFSAMD